MRRHRSIELEAQLSYATALTAGCLYFYYKLYTYTKSTGWEGLAQLGIALFAMVGLQLVVFGMGLHIYFRGHWMARAMVENWKLKCEREGRAFVPPTSSSGRGPASEDEAPVKDREGELSRLERVSFWLKNFFSQEVISESREEKRNRSEIDNLELLTLGTFYKTFQYMHFFLVFLVFMLACYGASHFNGWRAWLSIGLAIVLVSIKVVKLIASILFPFPVVKSAARRWEGLGIRFQRVIGLWTLPREFHRRRLDRVHRFFLFLLMLALVLINTMMVWQPHVDADKEVYVRRDDERVLLRFSHGAITSSYFVNTDFICHLSSLKPDAEEPQWYPLGGNSYIAVIDLDNLRSGVCRVNMEFTGYITSERTEEGSTSSTKTNMKTSTRFLLVE